MNIKLPIKPLTLLISIMICTTLKGESLSEQNYFNRLANDGTSIWVATSKGVVRYDKTEKRAYNENEALEIDENSVINCIKTDKSGKVWYSVKNEGVYCYDGVKVESYFDFYKEEFLRLAFAFDANDSIWVSAGGNYISPMVEGVRKGYTTPDTYSTSKNAYIMDMEFDSKGNLWISIFGEYNSLLCQKSNNSYCESVITEGGTVLPSLTIDKNDNIWYTVNNGLIYYNTQTGVQTLYSHDTDSNIPAAHFFASDIDENNNMWFTSSHYLVKYDGEKFKWWNSYGYHDPRGILCDGDVVWIYMSNDVLFRFEDDKFEKIDLAPEVAGIESNYIEKPNTKAFVSNGVLIVESPEEITNISVYDMVGRVITSANANGATSTQIALSSNTKGVLIVKVNNDVIKVACNN